MNHRILPALALAALTGGLSPRLAAQSTAPAPPSDLADYIKRPEPDFAWKLVDKSATDAGTVYTLHLVSQKWHGELWEHQMQVFLPKGVTAPTGMVLYNTGGNPVPITTILGVEIARRSGLPMAMLFGVPKQPLYGGKKEDALIAETFVRYLETGDGTWPLLFPMAKSVVKAMDALQAFAKQEWKADLTGFVVTGASKRGWTSWLTAASGDPRVKAIAPMVIDTLNFQKQLPLHLTSFGDYSRMIHDYKERNLLPLPDTAAGRRLWGMVDPWIYRGKLTLPKLLLLGTNDPYWPQEALNQYWDDLPGDKWVEYVPNAGHDLREISADGGRQTFPMRAVNTLAAFARHVLAGKPMPRLTWTHADEDGQAYLAVESDLPIKEVRLWEATSATPDFRKARWAVGPTVKTNVLKTGLGTAVPKEGYKAFFAECEYDLDGRPFSLTTQLRVIGAK